MLEIAHGQPDTSARVVTLEDVPRVLELRGIESGVVNHAYGNTGIVTALEMPLAPAWPWVSLIAAFDSFAEAVAFAHAVALTDGIAKKLLTPIAWPMSGCTILALSRSA